MFLVENILALIGREDDCQTRGISDTSCGGRPSLIIITFLDGAMKTLVSTILNFVVTKDNESGEGSGG